MDERTRKLASIQKVIDIKPITFQNEAGQEETAQAIEQITVQGWHLVAKKGEFKVGDFCIYFEIDSFLPVDKPQFAFLLNKGTKKMIVDNVETVGIRLKTIRLKGVISQGLALPLESFPEEMEEVYKGEADYYVSTISQSETPEDSVLHEIFEDIVSRESTKHPEYLEGVDMTDILKVLKYEAPLSASLSGMARGNFPSFIPKTDEPRIQSNTRLLEKYKDEEFYIAEKLDGSSTTIYLANTENKDTNEIELTFGVCSRNLDLKETEGNTYWKVARKMNIEEKLRKIYEETGVEYSVQGELCGEGIQGNKLKIVGQKIFFYNVWDITNQKYLSFNDFKDFIINKLGCEIVPIIYERHKLTFKNVDEIVEFVTIKSSINPNTWQEGFVFRTMDEKEDSKVGRVSFKCISPQFLLSGGE